MIYIITESIKVLIIAEGSISLRLYENTCPDWSTAWNFCLKNTKFKRNCFVSSIGLTLAFRVHLAFNQFILHVFKHVFWGTRSFCEDVCLFLRSSSLVETVSMRTKSWRNWLRCLAIFGKRFCFHLVRYFAIFIHAVGGLCYFSSC